MIRGRVLEFQRKVCRESLRMYCFRLQNTIPGIKPGVSVDVEVYDHPVKLESVQSRVVEERISQGNKIFVANYQFKPIAYIFVTKTNCWVEEIADKLQLGSNEVYLYDAYTNSEYRGNRIYPYLISNVARFYKERDYSCALIFTTSSNNRSKRGIQRAGFVCYQVIDFYNFGGLSIWNFKLRSRIVKSRFSCEN